MNKLKEYREKNKLTLRELSNAINITTTRLSRYENGKNKPDMHTLILLSKYYNVTVDQLLGIDDLKTDQSIDSASVDQNTDWEFNTDWDGSDNGSDRINDQDVINDSINDVINDSIKVAVPIAITELADKIINSDHRVIIAKIIDELIKCSDYNILRVFYKMVKGLNRLDD